MFEKSLERMAAERDRPFQVYLEARLAFEDYLGEHPVPDDRLAEEDYSRAAADLRMQKAEAGYRQTIELTSFVEHPHDLAVVLSQLGWLLHLCGRFAEARDAFYECLHVLDAMARTEADDLHIVRTCQYHLGLLNLREGHYASARQRLGISVALDEELGDFARQEMGQAALDSCPADDGSPEPLPRLATHYSPRAGASGVPEPDSPPDYLAAEDEEVERPGIFGATTREAIWILAASEDSVTQLREIAQRACPPKRELVIFGAASESGTQTPPPMAPGTSLCAAIFEISPAALSSDDFRYWIRWCINRAFEAADFRLFVHLNGIGETEFVELAKGDVLVGELRDKVQLHRPDRLDLLETNLRSHLLRLEITRDVAKGRRMLNVAARLLGGISTFAISLSIVFWLAVSSGALILGEARVFAGLGIWTSARDWFGVLGGLPLAWCALIPLALFMHNWKRSPISTISTKRSLFWIVFSMFVVRASVWLPREIHSPARAIVLGGIMGLLLEAARRRRAMLARSNLLQIGRQIAEQRSLPASLLQLGFADPKQWPLFAAGSRVFISYSRSSAWGSRLADVLHARLMASGYDSFLDRLSIPPGASWQRQLDQQIGEADAFIALCDPISVQRPWVAAELAAALAGRQISGFPQIVLLQYKSLTPSALAGSLPVFKKVFEVARNREHEAPRVVLVDDAMPVAALVTTLMPRRLGRIAVFPSWVRSTLLALASPFMLVATLVPILGIPALLIGIGMKLGKISLETWFRRPILWWLAIAVAAMLGTTVRQAIGARFEGLSKQKGRGVYSRMKLCAIGFFLLGVQVWSHFHGTEIVWAVVAAWSGWILTECFTEVFKKKDRNRAARSRV